MTPLGVKLRMGKDVSWISLMLPVDIEKWLAVSSSERKTSNLLDKLGYTKRIQEIEFAIKDLRKKHKLTRENVSAAIDSIVLAEHRETLSKDEALRDKYVKRVRNSFRNTLIYYVDSAVDCG